MSYDVAACMSCVARAMQPNMTYRRGALSRVPAGHTVTYDPHDNGGWHSEHPCDTCPRTTPGIRRVLTIHPPERSTMPTTNAVATPQAVLHYVSVRVNICTDCLNAAANGESEVDTALNRVADGYHVIPGGLMPPYFSSVPCDTCTNVLGGDRHDAVLMSVERVPCQDCIALVRHVHDDSFATDPFGD